MSQNGIKPAHSMVEGRGNMGDGDVSYWGEPGVTKREYFAAAALQGTLANSTDMGDWTAADAARMAVEFADALLEALDK
jgi:hypothetical protein